jgi:multidrug efflux pump subunit AcrA (membrane-fusion protein)
MGYPINTHKFLSLILCGAIILSACSGLTAQATPTVEPPRSQDITPVVNATGVVAPAQYSTLSVSTAGIVTEVLVKQGEVVKEDQVLARLKGSEDLQAAITASRFELQSASKALDDLDKSAETMRTEALQAISAYAGQVRDAQYQLDHFTVPTNQAKLSAMQAMDQMKAILEQATQAYQPCKNIAESNQTQQCKDLKEALDDAQSDYNATVRRLGYETDLQVAKANLDKARKDYDTWKNGPDPDEVALTQARIDNAKAALAAAQAALNDLELHAPFAGTVSEVYAHLGEWVVPGQPILQLADLGHLRIETTDLNEIDAARIKAGSIVKVTFDALPDVVVTGTVASIAPKAAQGSGVNYTAIIELAETPSALRWGMTAFVDITAE